MLAICDLRLFSCPAPLIWSVDNYGTDTAVEIEAGVDRALRET